ncbi:Arc family DNA-binding protein [Acinetobacter radioresistens]|uniref:Arc family DNA-binding protein n=1 Tax=Acinetobacter radioresistens TaxID=40216 RepID=UPI0020067D9E|nr:Arc family DNA-binding protein [Acinetobacter radioresistens]MCK4083653.1 Arc family DNA-binding protein [Acinetobacter radioresistens]
MTKNSSKDFEQLNIRLNSGLRDKLKEMAKKNNRSLNGHVEFILEKSITDDENQVIKYLLHRIKQLESELEATKP